MDRFQELIDKWQERSFAKWEGRKRDASHAFDECIEDLRTVLILEEADKVLAQAAQELRGTLG